jgi:PAS domain S-box-containing protein
MMPALLSSELVRSVLDSAPDAMIVIDGAGAVLFANRQVSTLFGYLPKEIVGQRVEFLMPERFRNRHVAHRGHYSESVRLRPMGIGLDLFARRKDGTEFPVEISLSPIEDGTNVLVGAAIRDVTDRMRVEQELKEAHVAADRANRAKSRFLATASHDLRQPLQTLGLLNGALRRTIADPEALEALAHQDQAIAAMSRLLNTLLDISKLESGAIKPELTNFKMSTLFEELGNEFADVAKAKGLAFRIESCPACGHSDPSLLGQVLRNLVSNAIKYTPQGFVEIRAREDGATVHIDVVDSGIGIPADQLAHIYDEFYQVGVSANASRNGYGLGLSIVQRVAQLLHLGIEVASQPGRGSTFSVVVPAAAAADTASLHPAAAGRAPASPVYQPHVLLVEDDAGVRNATRMLLKVAGYRVTASASGAEALERAHQHRDFDLIVTDYHLEDGETGIDVIASVRALLRSDLKAILVTGDTSSAVHALQRDAQLRLASKPINADELLRLMTGLLSAR